MHLCSLSFSLSLSLISHKLWYRQFYHPLSVDIDCLKSLTKILKKLCFINGVQQLNSCCIISTLWNRGTEQFKKKKNWQFVTKLSDFIDSSKSLNLFHINFWRQCCLHQCITSTCSKIPVFTSNIICKEIAWVVISS